MAHEVWVQIFATLAAYQLLAKPSIEAHHDSTTMVSDRCRRILFEKAPLGLSMAERVGP